MADTKNTTKGASAQTANRETQTIGKGDVGKLEDVLNPAAPSTSTEGKLVGTPTSTPLAPFKVQKANKLPEGFGTKTSSGTGSIGMADALRGLKEKGDFFEVPKVANEKGGYKRNNSRFATIRKNAKDWGIEIWIESYNETTDRVWFVSKKAPATPPAAK